ncbi:MAG: MinD/ParA family protein [Chloroflexi bacterium]|nr:MinD/ParA family protein [Chloroflexota bacterium]
MMRRALAELIDAQPDMEVVDTAANGHEAVRRAIELQPDIVLMDVHMPDMDGIQATWLVSNKAPHGAVIMVTSEERIDFLQKAMAAGAHGYVLKPYGDGAKLLETVREVHGRARTRQVIVPDSEAAVSSMPIQMGKRVSVFGAKGGAGKTSLAVGLAITLRQQTSGSVIIFDADFHFGDAAIHLDMTPEHSILDLVPYMDALDSTLIERVVGKGSHGVHLLARPPRPEQADVIKPDHVRTIMSILRTMYDFVVIDTQPSYDERMLAVLDLTDVYVIVLAPDVGPVRDTRHFLDVAQTLGYPAERMCFALNRANSLTGLSMNDIASAIGTRRVFQLPSAGLALSRAINDGRPLVVDQPKAPYSRAVAAIADHVRMIASGVQAPAR